MDTDPKAVAQRYYDAVNSDDINRLDDVCAPDMIGHAGAGANLVQLKLSVQSFTDAFADAKFEVRHLVAEGNLVSSWYTFTGTHERDFAGVPGSGRPVRMAGWDLFVVRDGRLAELTSYCDLFTALNQIGALPTAAPA